MNNKQPELGDGSLKVSCGPADRSFGDELWACHGFDIGRGVAQA